MLTCFGVKKMNKKSDKNVSQIISSDTHVNIYRRETSVTTHVTERSKFVGNTFPRRRAQDSKDNLQELKQLFSPSSDNVNSNPYQNLRVPGALSNNSKINLLYKSPYRNEKDALEFKQTPSTSPGISNQNYFNRPRLLGSFSTTNTGLLSQPKSTVTRSVSTGDVNNIPKEKKLNIVVKPSKKKYDSNNKIPTYSTHGKKRGCLLLINNILFNNSNDRKGAEVDEMNLKELFKKFDFYVHFEKNLKKSDMISKLEKYSKLKKLKEVDINVIIIMSHGQGDKSGVTNIFGTDDKGLSICEILEKFNDVACPYLMNKPKIFMFMCCRGDNEAAIEKDTVQLQKPSKDMLVAYSTSPGFVSYRNPISGTFYTRALCEIFMEHAHDTHVEDLLKMVEAKLGSLVKQEAGMVQTSGYENRGFKLCYLHPK